jgi:diguanylate cyclase (GGDEF)-like protein
MRDQLEHRAFHDGLTGLPNRARFLQQLEESVTRPAPADEQAAVLFIDLDRFKPVNDSLGHDAGNELLIAVAQRLVRAVGADDTVGRLGGDEFVVLLDRVGTPEDATGVAERLVGTLNEPFVVASHEVAISCSVGIAMAPRPFTNPAELVRRADQAMYRAKAGGRARWALYQAGHDTASVTRLQLEADLRTALQRDQLRLVYQPIYRAYDQSIVAVEALVRWDHPQHGAIPPSTLIPMAEESGLIVDLGRWVLRTATRAHAQWRQAPRGATLLLAVNVSPSQLNHPAFSPDLDRILGETAMPPASLLLEVTENVVALGSDLVDLMHSLRARGVRLALDDFGQGQTSLRHLRELPLDVLKIDKVFVDGLAGEEAHDRAIVRSVISLAHELGLRVIAEGIEVEDQLVLLREMRADLVQGYLLHRPATPEQVALLLGGVPTPLASRAAAGVRA